MLRSVQLALERVEVDGEQAGSVPVTGDGPVALGPLEVVLHHQPAGEWPTTVWSIANRGDAPVPVRSVGLVHRLEHRGPLDLFANGYQSWSRTGVVRVGEATDPASTDTFALARAMHHPDQAVPPRGPLRSEAVAVLADRGATRLLVGFESGREHDGTVWVRPAGDGVEVVVQAFLGGAVLAPGEQRPLHGVVVADGDDASALLEGWAAYAGAFQGARTGEPYQVGWCSWYQYFHALDEQVLRANLARAEAWPFEVFQVDDGFQAAIGDWLVTNERFPSSVDALAADIAAAGFRPGIWLAPFLAAPGSELQRAHPDWVAQHASGRALVGNVVPEWGGAVHVLDTTRPEVLDHLERLAAQLVEMGFTYLKLDFTYAPGIEGRFADPSRTPAQRVRAGFDAIRRGAGDEAFLLGCGAPLGCTVGVVDGMRIGPDVAPAWEPQFDVPGYAEVVPATVNAWRNTLTRSFMHRRLWLNDPDCLMLRTTSTDLSPEAVETWARAVGVSGGLAVVSDDLALLGDDARRLLDDVLALGREADAEAANGRPARCGDLLDAATPGQLATSTATLEADPATARSTLRRRLPVTGA